MIYFHCEVAGLTAGPQRLHPGMMMSWFQCLLCVNIRLGRNYVLGSRVHLGGSVRGKQKLQRMSLHFRAGTNR